VVETVGGKPYQPKDTLSALWSFRAGFLPYMRREWDGMHLPTLPFPETKCASFDIHDSIPCYKGFFRKHLLIRLLDRSPVFARPQSLPQALNTTVLSRQLGKINPQGGTYVWMWLWKEETEERTTGTDPETITGCYHNIFHFIFITSFFWLAQ